MMLFISIYPYVHASHPGSGQRPASRSIHETMSLTRTVEPSVIQKTLSRKQTRRSAVRNGSGASVSTRTFGSLHIAVCNLPRCVASKLISFHRIELCRDYGALPVISAAVTIGYAANLRTIRLGSARHFAE